MYSNYATAVLGRYSFSSHYFPESPTDTEKVA